NAVKFLSKAIEIAETIKDTTKVLNYSEYLMRHYLVIKDIEQANRVKNIYLSKYGSLNPDLALDLSYLYAVKYMPDSSSYYIKVINGLTLDDKQKLMAIKANSALQAAKGNYKEAMRLSEQFSYISDSLSHNNDKLAIANMEFERANQRKEELTSQLQVSRNVNVSIMLICLVAIVSVILTVFLYRRQRNIVASNRELYRQLSKEKINEHKELSELLANNNDLKLIFERYLTFIRTLVNICTVLPEKHGLEIIRKAINPEISSELVSGLVQFVNMQNDNILNKLSSQYPKISRQQIGLICLTALDFSDAEIALILGYRTSSIRVLRRRLEKKLDFDGKFKELLKNQGAV
ncbi:MAG: hypothetical protein IJ626_04335, partial [Muribaculaceae bacterium]|nr:hypothetical protein [Muribaculaceae bacterium]